MAVLTIASKNYGSWSLRGWLLCKMAGLEFTEEQTKSDDPSTRAELLLLSPSFLVPCLTHDGVKVWDTLAIAEYQFTAEERVKFTPVRHRLVRTNPTTGRKSLFLSCHIGGIVGWPVPEANGLRARSYRSMRPSDNSFTPMPGDNMIS
jgi:hypothetical protein